MNETRPLLLPNRTLYISNDTLVQLQNSSVRIVFRSSNDYLR